MILVIDNHDSFVHNLARYVRRAGQATVVVRSDQIDAAQCERLAPQAIILSPGPKRPEDAGCCVEVIRHLGPTIPILGVCLGHQAIGYALGGDVIQVAPVHGRASEINHDGISIFAGCANPMLVARYHSLALDPTTMPDDLVINSTTAQPPGDARYDPSPAVVMAIRHRIWPLYGVQFHPESVLTIDGFHLISNFVNLATAYPFRSGNSATGQPTDHSQLVL